MKKILLSICAALLAFCGCQDFDSLSSRVDDLESRVKYLEELCKDMNGNITVIQAFVAAHQDDLYIRSVTEVADGFMITFSDGKTYTLKNGERGSKGDKGDKGDQGETGATGAVPVVSIAYDETDGGYYWTLNGEYILNDGKKISALGITPQLKIEDGKWLISYDGGKTWEEVAPAYDQSSSIEITEDADAVYFTLYDGTQFVIPKVPGFSFKVEKTDVAVVAGKPVELAYKLTDADETVRFEVRGDKYSAVVTPADAVSGTIKVNVPDPIEDGYVLITAVKNSTSEYKAQYISFEEGTLSVSSDAYNVSEFGEIINIEISTNIDKDNYSVDFTEDWISVVPETKSLRKDIVRLSVAANEGRQRTASVTVSAGEIVQTVTVVQAGASDEKPLFVVDTEDINVEYTATEAKISVVSNLPWSVSVPEGVTADQPVGSGDAEITLSFASNEGVYTPTEFEVTISVENAFVETSSYTVKVIKAAAPNPNEFTYVLWGNNLGLEPAAKYGNQFRTFVGEADLEIEVKETDIPEGRPVSYAVSSYTLTNKNRTGVEIDAQTGKLKITAKGDVDAQSAAVQCAIVTVTVGEGESAVTREIPVFVDHVTNTKRTYDVRFTPFVLRFNPEKGGSATPQVEARMAGTETVVEGFTIDYRRIFHWYSINSSFPSGRFDNSEAVGNPLEGAWRSYYSDAGLSYGGNGAYLPVSYSNNKAGTYGFMPVSINPSTYEVTVKPGAFAYEGEYGEGIFSGTLVCNEGNASPVAANKEHRPFLIWLDPSYTE